MSNEPFLRDTENAKLTEAGQVMFDAMRDFVRFVVRLIPALFRFACVAVAATLVAFGTIAAWQAFGGDMMALIPALTLGIVPLLFAFDAKVKFGGMVAAGAFTYIVAQLLTLLPYPIPQVSTIVALAALTFSEMSRRDMEQNTNELSE